MSLNRGGRRRRSTNENLELRARTLQFIKGWEGIISLSVLAVVVVLAQGILKLPMPFGIGEKPPVADAWGYVMVPRGANPKVVFVGDVSNGAKIDASGAKQGVEIALKELGKIQETTVELEVVEDACKAGDAATKARELADDPRVIGIVTQACGASVESARAVYEDKKLPYLALAETKPEITPQGTMATFRMRANERVQGRNAALFMRQDVPTQRALLLHDGAPSAQAIAEAFRTQYRGMRGEVRDLRQVSLTENFDALYQDIKTLDPDLIYYMGGGRTAAETLKALLERGYSGRFLVTDSAYADASYNTIGSVLEGTYATALQPARGDRFAFWKEAYEKDNGPVGLLSPEGYDAAAILLQAAARVAKVESDGTTKLGRQAMVGNIRSVPYTGITGVMGFDGNGDRSALTATMMKFENGQFKEAAAPVPTPVPAPAASPIASAPERAGP
ncbi:MAG: hypothetical protein EXR51_11875 [Dehalococcoidia bacterium]|nr:hypothetical protein [Dehalococcoidia bacterium]